MSATGLDVFDRTLQSTNIWLDDLMREMNWTDRHKAYHALRAGLHALRDRMPVNDAAHLSAQLPMLVRGIYFEGWKPSATPVKERSPDDFLAHMADAFLFDPATDPREVIQAVFKVLSEHITEGEFEKVINILPKSFSELCPAEVGGKA